MSVNGRSLFFHRDSWGTDMGGGGNYFKMISGKGEDKCYVIYFHWHTFLSWSPLESFFVKADYPFVFLCDTKRSHSCELTAVVPSDNFSSTSISFPILVKASMSCQSMSRNGSNVSAALFSFSPPSVNILKKSRSVMIFLNPVFRKKVRIQLF